jgi:sigma-E factor negative regulatory protein RseC
VREEGIVVESHGDRATIAVERGSACKHCSAKALCRPFGETSNRIEVANPIGAEQGQRVVVAIEPTRLVRNAVVLYGVPLVALIIGAALGSHVARVLLGDNAADIGAIVGAAVFLAAALIALRVLDRRAAGRLDRLPRIVETLDR